ncbi:MAG: 4Fe-4S binding protein [Betaproteobacteria bacterium]|nr:4Fe-4S binding protein [Betaproteobacteria bacterium]
MTLDDRAAGSGNDSGDLPHDELQARVARAESRGWTPLAVDCAPKIRALEALASLPEVEPVASVGYSSKGNVLVIGGDERAVGAAARLSPSLPVTLLLTSRPSAQAAALANAELGDASFPIWGGKVSALKGYLGNFSVAITDLAAVREAGDRGLPGAAGAIFDLVIDFSDPPLFGHHTPPQGYWRIAGDASLETALAGALEAVGEFEKPRFFAYRENLCAHSRSGIVGCSNCIDVCSTEAIAADGDHVKVDPYLCMGCGACATVCPSGAMSFKFPRVEDRGTQLRALLAAYRDAGGRDACVLFHNGTDGRELLAASASAGPGLPARVIPMESWHVASVGIDLLLGAVALGANQVAILSAGSEAPEYAIALRGQMDLAQSILAGLGYAGRHFALVETADPRAASDALQALAPAAVPPAAATFALSGDKRTAVEFAVEHFARHAPTPVTEIALAAGAPYGEIRVDKAKCTLCLACAGACPESAIMDGTDVPMLRFLERNCVQCGLCVNTCPEDAIGLQPRLLLTGQAKLPVVLNEAEPFDCIRCGKPFGTRRMVDNMLARLGQHSMFAGEGALKRLQMCGECRVIDMVASTDETSIFDYTDSDKAVPGRSGTGNSGGK